MNVIIAAAQTAKSFHSRQKRKWSNAPYITHPARVATRVMLIPGVVEMHVAAAWLHDVIEDTQATYPDLQRSFDEETVRLVEELTNTEHPAGIARAEKKDSDRRRIACISPWAKRIKIVDRIDNLNELTGASQAFASLYFHESVLLWNVLFDAATEELTKEFYEALNKAWHLCS